MITETFDHHDIDLAGYKVMQCLVDFAFTLELNKDRQRVTIRVSGPFQVEQAGAVDELDAEANRRGLGPALALYGKSVRSAVVRKTGELEIGFYDGAVMRVPPEPEYESWTLTVTNGPIVVSGPGGTLTFFGWPKAAGPSTSER